MIQINNGRGYEDGVTAVCSRTGQQIGAASVEGLRQSVEDVELEYRQAVDRAQASLDRFRAFGVEVVAAAEARMARDHEDEVREASAEVVAAQRRLDALKAAG